MHRKINFIALKERKFGFKASKTDEKIRLICVKSEFLKFEFQISFNKKFNFSLNLALNLSNQTPALKAISIFSISPNLNVSFVAKSL